MMAEGNGIRAAGLSGSCGLVFETLSKKNERGGRGLGFS
jgi:hypothetical protein